MWAVGSAGRGSEAWASVVVVLVVIVIVVVVVMALGGGNVSMPPDRMCMHR